MNKNPFPAPITHTPCCPLPQATFHNVEIPGVDPKVTPPQNGAYRNVIITYTDTGDVYIYNSDGIPMWLTSLTFQGLSVDTYLDESSTNPIANHPVALALNKKVDKVDGYGLSQNDFTDALLNKLNGIATGAEVNVKSDWDATSGDAEILNKPALATVATSGSYNDLSDKPTAVSAFSNDANYQNAQQVEETILDNVSGESTRVDNLLNDTYVSSIAVNSTPSTDTITLIDGMKNILTKSTSTTELPLPVASSSSAGVMNSATFNSLQNVAHKLDVLEDATVAVSGLPESPTDEELTQAWQNATGATELVNGAKTYDQDNFKIWTYYSNTASWIAADTTTTVTVNQWTNSAAGIVKGSSEDGQIFAENDGTGSVNGWDAVKSKLNGIAAGAEVNVNADWNATSGDAQILNKPSLAAVATSGSYTDLSNKPTIPTVNNATLTIQKNGSTVKTFTANASSDVTANITVPTFTYTSSTKTLAITY